MVIMAQSSHGAEDRTFRDFVSQVGSTTLDEQRAKRAMLISPP